MSIKCKRTPDELEAKLALAKEIYKTYDKSVNAKYKIDVNNNGTKSTRLSE